MYFLKEFLVWFCLLLIVFTTVLWASFTFVPPSRFIFFTFSPFHLFLLFSILFTTYYFHYSPVGQVHLCAPFKFHLFHFFTCFTYWVQGVLFKDYSVVRLKWICFIATQSCGPVPMFHLCAVFMFHLCFHVSPFSLCHLFTFFTFHTFGRLTPANKF